MSGSSKSRDCRRWTRGWTGTPWRVGLTARDVYDTLASALAGREAGSIYEGDRRFDVVVRLEEGARQDLDGLRRLPVMTPADGFVPVGSVAELGSWRAMAIVFTGVPLALISGVAVPWLRGLPFSISAAVGFIALSGVTVLNGLVMAGAIDDLGKSMPWDRAVREGALRRLRPVVMTALWRRWDSCRWRWQPVPAWKCSAR